MNGQPARPEGEPIVVALPPRWIRNYLIVFGSVWFAFLCLFFVVVITSSAWGALPILVLLSASGAFILRRTSRLGLFAFSDSVVVRNFFVTRRIPKGAVDGFRIGGAGMPWSIGQTIVVLTAGDTALRLTPPLTISEEEADLGVDLIRETLG